MLIIDKTRINELKDYGFKPKYDEDTGEIVSYRYNLNIDMDEDVIIKRLRPKHKTILFMIFKRKNEHNDDIWVISKYCSYFSIEILYKLFEAGLVKEV